MKVSEAVQAARDAMGKPTPDSGATGGCYALGCPCAPSCSVGGGKSICSWHAQAQGDTWTRITEQLVEHRWLIDFIGELRRSFSRGKPGEWLTLARDFFRTDPPCQPTGAENRPLSFPLYEWRLREELAYRVGVRKDRPEPRIPGQATGARQAVLEGLPERFTTGRQS